MRLGKEEKSNSRERNLEREHILFHSLGLEAFCLVCSVGSPRLESGSQGWANSGTCTLYRRSRVSSLRSADPRRQSTGAAERGACGMRLCLRLAGGGEGEKQGPKVGQG